MMAKWHHMVTYNWVNIGSGNGLLPDGTKPLPEPMLICICEVQSQGLLRVISQDTHTSSINSPNKFENYLSKISL